MPRAQALEQLCAPPAWGGGVATLAFTGPPPSTVTLSAGACDGELYRCERGTVIQCGDTPNPLAACRKGCTEEGATIDDDNVGADGAVAILCVH